MNELVLIFDDEVSTLKLFGMALEREGYRIAAAQDARQALARIEVEVPELVILDVMMPGVSGLDLL
jgi:DNA-binding response OmpR family regulator